MKAILLALLVSCSSLFGESAKPTSADFIPAQARIYFDHARGTQYWGEPSGIWRVATRHTTDSVAYLSDGGLGEFLSFGISVFTSDSRWEQLCERKTLSFTVTVSAIGRDPFTKALELPTSSFSGNSYGVCWGFDYSVDLFALRDAWGGLPDSLQVRVTLADADLPHPDSAVASIRLTPIVQAAATFQQRLSSLRKGQLKQDVISILGQPNNTTEPNTGDNHSPNQRLEYAVPNAPKPIHRRKEGRTDYCVHNSGERGMRASLVQGERIEKRSLPIIRPSPLSSLSLLSGSRTLTRPACMEVTGFPSSTQPVFYIREESPRRAENTFSWGSSCRSKTVMTSELEILACLQF